MVLKERQSRRHKHNPQQKGGFYLKKRTKFAPSFLSVFLMSSAFINPAYGMVADLFNPHEPFLKGRVVPQIFSRLDDRSLGKAAQVSHDWKYWSYDARQRRRDLEKFDLYELILEVTGAEPNEVERAHDHLRKYFKTQAQEYPFLKTLETLKKRLVQPESLIRSNLSLYTHLLTTPTIQLSDKALEPLVTLIKDLKDKTEPNTRIGTLEKILLPLLIHYENYLKKLILLPREDRALHLQPKALLSGEAFLGCNGGITSYRLSQEMARSLLSKSEFGLPLRTNTFGSHAVSFKSKREDKTCGVHFKGNTTNTGLAVARESAVDSLFHILFRRGTAVTALLTLNEVDIKTPQPHTPANQAFTEALMKGQSSDDFFNQYPLYEKEFTKKDPAHIVQAGFHVEGISLDSFMEGVETEAYLYEDIDLGSFSEHIIISALIHPTDGTPGNFILKKHQKQTSLNSSANSFTIVGIDNDMALEPGDVAVENVIPRIGEKGGSQKKHSVRVKNALLCLPPMDRLLDPPVIKRILSLNPELAALQWLGFLKGQNEKYAQLQKGSYHKDQYNPQNEGTETSPYLSPSHMSDLHLPFLLNPTFIAEFCATIREMQTYLQDHKAATHWQLLLKLHPLSSRFYQEMLIKEKASPMKAYMSIDPRYKKHEPEQKERDVTYLEDVFSLDEKLDNNQTVGDALKAVTSRPDGAQTLTQSVDEAARDLLSKVDLFRQPSLGEFIETALTSFGPLLTKKPDPSDAFPLHESWSKDSLLIKAMTEKISIKGIQLLLTRGLDVSIMDEERRTLLRLAVEKGYPAFLLKMLKEAYRGNQLSIWLNSADRDRITALDRALETKQLDLFKELVNLGAFQCHGLIALKFYQTCIQKTKDHVLKHAFLKLMALNEEVRWHICIHEMLPLYQKNSQGIPLSTPKFLKRLLASNLKDQLFQGETPNEKQTNLQWKPYTTNANHTVSRATIKNEDLGVEHGLYFKIYPELPGIEEGVGLLTRMLLGYGAPHTDLANINGIPVLLSHSHGTQDKTLESIIKKEPDLLKNLHEESISGLILVAILINPEDGKPSNYVVEPHPTSPNKYRIIGIDNDHAFVPAVVKEKPSKELFSGKLIPVAQVKTILYCLDQMKHPVHPNIRAHFINLRPDELLDTWLRELKKINNGYNDLFPNSEDHVQFFKKYECVIGIPFQKGAISHLYDKFVNLREALSQNPIITHIELLEKLEQRLAKRYKQALEQLPTVKERWNAVDAPFYEKTKIGSETTLTRSGDILKSMDIPLEESVLDSIRKGKSLGPIQALEELHKQKDVVQIKILEALGARAKDFNFLKTLSVEATRAKFLETTDFKTLTQQEHEAILSYLKRKKLENLTLKNCSLLKDNWLMQNLDLSSLVKLDLRGCEGITYRSLVHLSKTALNLEELNLSHITTLREIGDLGTFTDAPLIFNTLRVLNLNGCISLSKLLIQVPILRYLNVESCNLLTDKILDEAIKDSNDLQNLVFKGCSLITDGKLKQLGPPYLTSYWQTFKGRTALLKVLENKEPELSFKPKEINTTMQGLFAFQRALQININLSMLTSLHLHGNGLTNIGAKALSSCNLTALRWLELDKNLIGNEGLNFLAAGNFTNLEVLSLIDNNISDSGIQAIKAKNFPALIWLNLAINQIGDEGVSFLATAHLLNLTWLSLKHNKIESSGARFLANGNYKALKELYLNNNNIGNLGVKFLSTGNLSNLNVLNLKNNNIEKAGISTLITGNLASLIKLNLKNNDIEEGAKRILRRRYPQTNIKF